MEMMAAIVVLGIVAALAFAAIGHNQRTAYQTEMDETAKEIYIAAQSHLTVAESLGTLSGQTPGTEDTTTSDEGDIYYYVVGSSGNAALSNKKSMLYTMLPPMSIDETVRTGGSYIIRYQCEPNGSAARVLDVFYAKPKSSGFSGGFSYAFSDGDFVTLFSQAVYRSSGSDGVQARGNYNGAIIGYYGGASTLASEDSLEAPTLEIYNGEILAARLTNPDSISLDDDVHFEFFITGMTSGAVSNPIVKTRSDIEYINGKRCIQVVLDSVTNSNSAHFANLESAVAGRNFIPGENIKVQAYAIDTTSLRLSKSAKRTTNSLFGALTSTSVTNLVDAFKKLALGGILSTQAVSVSSATPTATISNIRHLENLSQAISGYDPAKLNTKAPAAYDQLTNLSWPQFRTAAAQWSTATADAICVYPLSGDASQAGTFMPVNWASGAFAYEGNAHSITGVVVRNAENAGLFGTLDCSSVLNAGSVSNLELVDFQVGTTNGNAGVLAGATNNVNATNVLARHQTTSDATYVTGTTGVGGLVGQTTGGTIAGCAAAVYVESNGASGTSAAGGLVGAASGTTIQYSYAGGHTTNGTYAGSDGSRYGSNVLSANGTAGGLVGTLATSASIANSYSTCSATGATAGRLVGSGSGNVGSTCYAVGAENGEEWDITDLNGSTLSTSAYDDLVAGGSAAAFPYDSTLTSKYNGKYQFKAISDFSGATAALGLSTESAMKLTKHLSAHYGDWPAIVTWVVNS